MFGAHVTKVLVSGAVAGYGLGVEPDLTPWRKGARSMVGDRVRLSSVFTNR